jgi:hypothetical protein
MYMDDSNHEFSVNNLLDVLVALLSWLAFLISVAAVSKGVNLAIGWFMFGLVVSTVWIPVSAFGNRNPDWVRYGWFALMNVVQVLGLGAV